MLTVEPLTIAHPFEVEIWGSAVGRSNCEMGKKGAPWRVELGVGFGERYMGQ